MSLYAVILAGGSGTRLWPASLPHHPKQFLRLFNDQSLLQATHARISSVVSNEQTLVVTTQEYVALVREHLPMLPATNILVEPAARGTAAAIGLAAVHLHHRDPAAVMLVLPADHLVTDPAGFRRLLPGAEWLAEMGWLVTLGIPPVAPESAYGYIERGDAIALDARFDVGTFKASRFVEKPDAESARRLLASGHYWWNSGIFVWTTARILAEFAAHLPELATGLAAIAACLGTVEETSTVQRVWQHLRNETIDYGVLERSSRVAMMPAAIGWSDVGSWDAVYQNLPHDAEGNAMFGQHLPFDTVGSLIISSSRRVVTLGLVDMVVVDSADTLFVCPRSRAQDVKHVVAALRERDCEAC